MIKTEIKKLGKEYVTLLNAALNDVKLPEEVWKKIAKVNQVMLDKYKDY